MRLVEEADKLIHSADPQSRPAVITIFARGVCLTFQNLAQKHISSEN